MSKEERRGDTGENSTDKILEEIEQDKKYIKKSSTLAFAALIAIIALCIAWYVANTRVTGTSVSVSAKNDIPFVLASVGERQNAESKYLLDENGNQRLRDGEAKKYSSYIDAKTGAKIETEEKDYYIGINELAWRLDGQESLRPGEMGELEFYFIPTKSGANKTKVNVTIKIEAKKLDGNKIVENTDTKLQNLVNGHILLFQNLNNENGFSGWLYKEGTNTMTINAPEGGFEKDVLYKVKMYWVWPKYFRNYVFDSRNTYGDLFTDISDKNKDYIELLKYVNSHKEDIFGDSIITDEINKKISDEILDNCSKYYNEADEYIGQSKCYIYVSASVQ